jgi:hypothetical protein
LDPYDKALVQDLPQAFFVRLVRRMNEVGQKPLLKPRLRRKNYNKIARSHG